MKRSTEAISAGWDGIVIMGQGSSTSTFGVNNCQKWKSKFLSSPSLYSARIVWSAFWHNKLNRRRRKCLTTLLSSSCKIQTEAGRSWLLGANGLNLKPGATFSALISSHQGYIPPYLGHLGRGQMVDWEQKILQNGDTNVYGQVKQWLLLQLFGSYLELLHERGGAGLGMADVLTTIQYQYQFCRFLFVQ